MRSKHGTIMLFITIVIGTFCIGYFLNQRDERKLSARKKETQGVIEQIESVLRGSGLRIWYVYDVNDTSFKKSHQLFVDSRHKRYIEQLLQGKRFLVIYDTADIENSSLLLTEEDFKRYKVQPPDSLRELIAALAEIKN